MRRWCHGLLLMSLLLMLLGAPIVQAAPAVVHAVLFYSPTCGHCHQVMTQDLPPLQQKYGPQLQIAEVNVTEDKGQALYQVALTQFNIPAERRGVPTLIVSDVVLVGSAEIPEQLPGLIEKYLAQGGINWPTLPGLPEAIATSVAVVVPSDEAPVENNPVSTQPVAANAWSNVMRDPIGNGLALIVLFGMLVSVVLVVPRRASRARAQPTRYEWAIPVLCLIGLVVAGYLAYVELAEVTAVCGPVGDCNTVQQSAYARLFGVLPIGVLGLIGYVAIIIAWGIERQGPALFKRLAALALVLMTLGGTLFSLYLTFLEPFVIGATCAWCVTSAILMTALLLLTVTPQRLALIKGHAA